VYVGVFLLTEAHWDQATLGAVLTVAASPASRFAPFGAFIDSTRGVV
jgi:hypothetical protein